MVKKYIYTPGPTNVRENVRKARSEEVTNPDIDEEFYEFYKDTCEKVGELLGTKNDTFILSGEGILGLEAACASLTEPGDRVLVIDNGVFGEGFKDFVKIYGGQPIMYSSNRREQIDVEDLRRFLEKDHDFKYATVVHCDTPSGMLNNISLICPLLKEFGIITVVDSVAAMIGEPLKVDDWKVDIALGGSQKAFSAETGLTIVTISQDAYEVMKSRAVPIIGFYCNLTIWENYYKNKWFPYTMSASDIKGFRRAVDNIMEEGLDNVHKRHREIAYAVRRSIQEYGFTLYAHNGYSSTVTVIEPPKGLSADKILDHIRDKYNVILAGSFDYLSGKVIRIGHMGENANIDRIVFVLHILDMAMRDLGYRTNIKLAEEFKRVFSS